jgi:hypothetical protein
MGTSRETTPPGSGLHKVFGETQADYLAGDLPTIAGQTKTAKLIRHELETNPPQTMAEVRGLSFNLHAAPGEGIPAVVFSPEQHRRMMADSIAEKLAEIHGSSFSVARAKVDALRGQAIDPNQKGERYIHDFDALLHQAAYGGGVDLSTAVPGKKINSDGYMPAHHHALLLGAYYAVSHIHHQYKTLVNQGVDHRTAAMKVTQPITSSVGRIDRFRQPFAEMPIIDRSRRPQNPLQQEAKHKVYANSKALISHFGGSFQQLRHGALAMMPRYDHDQQGLSSRDGDHIAIARLFFRGDKVTDRQTGKTFRTAEGGTSAAHGPNAGVNEGEQQVPANPMRPAWDAVDRRLGRAGPRQLPK